MQEIDTNLLESKFPGLLARHADSILGMETLGDQLCLVIKPEAIRPLISFFKYDPTANLEVMMDLFAMDYQRTETRMPSRFAVIYQLVNLMQKRRVFLKAYLPEKNPAIDSIHDLYRAANWFEREAWDLFGIQFTGHPNLVRILCHDEFAGHPLRKDYPSDKFQRLRNALPSEKL